MHIQDLEGGLFTIDPATLHWEKLERRSAS